MTSSTAPRQASISVAVRVRPFTTEEENKLVRRSSSPVFYGDGQLSQGPRQEYNGGSFPTGIRKILNVVDDKMLIFDPPESSPLANMQRRAFPNGPLKGRIRDYRFVFDHLFDEDASQDAVFENTTKPLLDSVLDGYNSTVFAYGATGCGKTHTISGTPEQPGVIFLTMKELYEKINLMSDTRQFDVTISFLEIYNETIRDLLEPATPPKMLNLREDSQRRIVVSHLSTHTPATVEEVMHLIMVGNNNRTSSPTEANAASSRSHAVLQINVMSRDRTANITEEHTYATLSIIDLAGSERAAATRNRGARLNEGANINKSLLALGNCINALCDPRRRNHVPYRDSKLTRLLKFSLGGNCRTVMIVCVSPSSQHYDETLNTLKYADRAKEIKTKVIRNRQNLDRHVGSYLKMITEQKQEIEELRAREAKAIRAAVDRMASHNMACERAISENITSLRATIDKQTHDKWRKYFSLAKRKLLLLQLKDLDLIIGFLRNNVGVALPHAARAFMVQAEQLQNKFNEQIITLERQYEALSEVDDILIRSKSYALRKFVEMEGWNDSLSETYHERFESLKDYIQKDYLVNSSVLFDYLVGKLTEFDYLPGLFSDFVHISHTHRTAADHKLTTAFNGAIEHATNVLVRMNDSDYDVAIESATTSFMNAKIEKEELGPAKCPTFTDRGETFVRLEANDRRRSSDKRAPTSPLRNVPATKRSTRILSGSLTSPNFAEDSEISIDTSSLLQKSDIEEESPIADHINKSLLNPEDLGFGSLLNSPPMRGGNSLTNTRVTALKHKPISLTETKLMLPDCEQSLLKFPLLNKRASTKVMNEKPEVAIQRAHEGEVDVDAK